MFDRARAAGLPMLGGCDVYAHYRDASVRAHFWAAGQRATDPKDKYKIAGAAPLPLKLQKTIVIFPGFTEFCEKYSKEVLCFHERGYNVLVIDWPGQGQSGHFGWHPLAVHCDNFDHHIGAMDAVIEKAGLDGHDLILFGHSMGGHGALTIGLKNHESKPHIIIGSALSFRRESITFFVSFTLPEMNRSNK